MLKKICLSIFTLSLLIVSCEYRKKDAIRGHHPVEHKGIRSVFVQNNSIGDSYSIYRSDELSVPMWCSVKENDYPMLMTFNANFINLKKTSTPTHFICYSGNKPSLGDKDIENPIFVEKIGSIKQTPFIEEVYTPYSSFYLLGLVLSAKVDELFPVYFNLYRQFCTDQSISCCMVNNGDHIVFDIILKSTDGINSLVALMDGIRHFISIKGISEEEIKSGFNIFNSTLVDKCSYERWYYDSLYMGIVRPETFLTYKSWLSYYKNTGSSELKVNGVGIKVIDSKRLSAQEFGFLRDSAKKLVSGF